MLRCCSFVHRAGLRPRLLIPIGLAAGIWACNQSGWHTVSRIEQGCLVLGFLSFKVIFFSTTIASNGSLASQSSKTSIVVQADM